MECKIMKLSDSFWKGFELDIQKGRIAYLKWALEYLTEPPKKYRHLLLWDDQKDFCIVNSRYGRAFSMSPYGSNVRGVLKSEIWNIGDNEIDIALKRKLTSNTGKIREGIRKSLLEGDIPGARASVLTYYWIKLGSHELLFDRTQYGRDPTGKLVKGRWGLDESEGWTTLTGIRNRIVNVARYGEDLEDIYVEHLDKRLPGFSRNSYNTFLSAAMTWNRYAMCAFDCGPVLWSKLGFVNFNMVKERMNKLGWPYQSTAYQVLKPLYHITLDYRKPPIRLKDMPDEGYDLKSMKRRKKQILRKLSQVWDEMVTRRNNIGKEK
jgi:hypothetical protein